MTSRPGGYWIMKRNAIDAPSELFLDIAYDNDVEYWKVPPKAPTQYLSHSYFRYIGKFPPQIAHKIIAEYGRPGGLLVDPMCGGGTSLIEAARLGMNTIGIDINPIAQLISRVTTKSIEPSRVKEEYQGITDVLSRIELQDLPLIETEQHQIPYPDDEDYSKYFSNDAYSNLILLNNHIDEIQDTACREFFYVALLSILRHVSRANVKKMNTEIDESKKEIPVAKAYRDKAFRMMKVNTILFDMGYPSTEITVRGGEASDTGIDIETADLVILHPPYLSGTAFSESLQLQLLWEGLDHKSFRSKELAMRGSYFHVPNGMRKYLVGWSRILNDSFKILRDGGFCAIVIGDGKVDYVRIPMNAISIEFAADIGFKKISSAKHVLHHNTGRTLNKRMKHQNVTIFQKT